MLLAGVSYTILASVAPDLAQTQLFWFVVGAIAFLIVRRIRPEVLATFWWVWYFGSIILLLITLFGPEVRGTHRWIEIFSFRIQPSELVKPFVVVSIAGYLSTLKKFSLKPFVLSGVLFLIPFILIFKQPDLGNSLVYLFSYFLMLTVSMFPRKFYVVPIFVFILTMPLLWGALETYQQTRISTFLNPSYDIQGAGYNARQALIAVGSGGVVGKGLGEGTQSKLQFLPEYHTDFIYASTVEQLGFIGGFAVIALYFILLLTMLKHASVEWSFQKLVVVGIFGQLFLQILVNIGMNLGLVPITGITLPLVSFGGSSILATAISLGIIDAFEKQKHQSIAIR